MENVSRVKYRPGDIPSEPGVYCATSERQKQVLYRFRYDIYVEDLNRLQSVADHEKRLFVEDEDLTAHQYFVVADKEIVTALRLNCGVDEPFSPRQLRQYDLEPLIDEISPHQIAIGERFVVRESYRGGDLLEQLLGPLLSLVNERRIQLVICDCEPFLLDRYLGLGFRPYTPRNVNSPEIGYLIPLVLVAEDVDYLRSIGSPLVDVVVDFGDGSRIPPSVPHLLAAAETVKSERLVPGGAYWAEIKPAVEPSADDQFTLFDAMSPSQIRKCLNKSTTIVCQRGDYIIRKGNAARNVFVALSGTLEVRDGDTLVDVVTAGDMFGEIAFLVGAQRSMDVCAVSDDVRVLSLSEGTLKTLVENDAEVAAKLLHNMAKVVSHRLLRRDS